MNLSLTRTLALRCMVALFLFLFAVANQAPAVSIPLEDIDSGTTSPTGDYRWLDIANQLYGATYQANYNYTQATVTVTFEPVDTTLHGTLEATNLKPNFAYQLKLAGSPGTPSNERIGFAGRWWQEEWNGSEWTNGQNLNNKGDGSSPTNPNDTVYLSRRDTPDPTSPTGLRYRYTGYLVFDYFITDDAGNALLNFEANSSFHVLWKTSQRGRTGDDGRVKSRAFDADPSSEAYDDDYPPKAVSLFGEWERLPAGEVFLQPGNYLAQMVITEESFHGNGEFDGTWAAAMGANIEFRIVTRCMADVNHTRDVDGSDLALLAADFGRIECTDDCPGDFDLDGHVDESDLAVLALDFGRNDCPEPLPPSPCNQFNVGDSIGVGDAADETIGEAHPEVVWSTGYDPSDVVDSLNERFEAADTWGHYDENNAAQDMIYNHAVSGAVMADFYDQASDVVAAASSTPSGKAGMVTILLGSNDVCTPSLDDDMTDPALFEAQYRAGLEVLASSEATRYAYIHVSSIPAIYWLWNAKRDYLWCRLIWVGGEVCQNLLANPADDDCESDASRLDPDTDYSGDGVHCKRRKDFHREIRMTYNRILREVLQEYINDGSLPNAYFVDIFDVQFEDIHINGGDFFKGDCFHPSVEGHRLLAEEQWCRWPWSLADPLCMP